MIKINKGKELQTLTKYRASINKKDRDSKTIYENFEHKSIEGYNLKERGNLRHQLLEEQGYVCCYCLSKIKCDNSKIEHFKPQSKYRKLQIDYKNLFISCEGKSGKIEHCDTKKAEQELFSIDLLSDIQNKVSYEKTGKIISEDQSINDELNEILNLNNEVLVKKRYQAYSDLIDNLKKAKGTKDWTKAFIEKIINKYKQKNKNGQYAEHYDMLLFFLQKRMNRLEK